MGSLRRPSFLGRQAFVREDRFVLYAGMPYSETMSHTASRTSRLEARISPHVLALVRRAAEIQGRSVSDFVVTAAQDAARKAVAEFQVIRLSARAQEQFAALLLNPPKPKAALARAFRRRRLLISE